MIRVLMVLPDGTLDPGFSGAASRYAQNFIALNRVGAEVHILRVCDEKQMAAGKAFEASLNGGMTLTFPPASWVDKSFSIPEQPAGRLHTWRQSLLNPVDFYYPAGPVIGRAIQERVTHIRPDLLWLERSITVQPLGQSTLPAVYSHHDIAYRVQTVRHSGKGWRQRYLIWVQRRAEEKVIRQAPHIVTGSATDAQRLRELGCPHVVTIPTAYASRPAPSEIAKADRDRLRVVHLGSLETTANRVGLLAYLREAHQEVTAQCAAVGFPLELKVIGDNRRVHPELAAELNRFTNIHQTGYVANLAEILCPFDVAILPYEHDTGYRTKLPLLFSFAQVVVATKAAVAGTPTAGLENVCVLVDRVADFPTALAVLANRPEERERLGRAAHEFFLKHYTHDAVQPAYDRFLEQVLERHP